ncbi:MAG: DUF2793 domain-containing protein [Parvularculaceae bacterium]
MSSSPRLGLSYLSPQQAQKHVTVNESLRRIDALAQLAVKSRSLGAQPPAPVEGEAYILPAAPGGAQWSAMAQHDLAVFQDGAWARIVPKTGWRAFIEDEARLVVRSAAGPWSEIGGGESAAKFGVNATADTTTRFQAKAEASLFSHDDVTPGSGDHRLKVNKSAAARTASLVFQDAFSGRAEFGLTGDDDFHVKVSADGSIWKEAIVVNRATGAVSLPFTLQSAGSAPNLLVNGDFQINQRGFGGGALSAGAYGFDRWKAASGGANATLSSYTLNLASGEIEQVVEPGLFGLASFASLAVTVSVEAPGADLTVTFGSQSGTISSGAGRRSATLTLGAGDAGNLPFKIRKASGSGVAFGRVKLEIGAAATAWAARFSAEEVRLCKRYYYRLGAQAHFVLALGFAFNSTTVEARVEHPVEMRANPAMTVSNVGNIQAGTAGYSQALSALVLHGGVTHSAKSAYLLATLASAVATTGAGNRLQSDSTNSGLVEFGAEL